MLMDDRLEFCDATSVSTAAAGLQLVGDVVNLGASVWQGGEEMYFVAQVDTAISVGTAAGTVVFALATDAAAGIAVDSTASVAWQSPSLTVSTLSAGYEIAKVALPMGLSEQYMGVLANFSLTPTAGKINAFLTKEPPSHRMVADTI